MGYAWLEAQGLINGAPEWENKEREKREGGWDSDAA